ncbi:MAG: magnesium-translocating P-type ATPase [Patescibacteria group bacterium]
MNTLSNNTKVFDAFSCSRTTVHTLMRNMSSSVHGLSVLKAEKLLHIYGHNEIAQGAHRTWYGHLGTIIRDPLNALLGALSAISYGTGSNESAVIIGVMVILSISMRFVQEHRADRAEEKLKRMVSAHTRVLRNGKEKTIHLKNVVPGDIILLSAGDLIPADVRVIAANDLAVDQSILTGESLPVEKNQEDIHTNSSQAIEAANLCFMGSYVQNGSGRAVVYATGMHTYFGSLAKKVLEQPSANDFELWVKHFTKLMVRIMLVVAPLVFVINGFGKGDWFEASLFALAVAVGLTPEMLPMIMTINLGKGAIDMSHKKVIVKQLDAIQSFGSMNILCTDKTGTLTQNKIVLEKHCDVDGKESEDVLFFAYVNSFFQTGLKNLLDKAILSHEHISLKGYKKIDEIPFDFVRRMMSVIVQKGKKRILISKGAPEEVFQRCTHYELNGALYPLNHTLTPRLKKEFDVLGNDGFRIIALGYKEVPIAKKEFTRDDEKNLTLLGYLAFFDPPKTSAKETISDLAQLGIEVKVLTGDNALVTQKICREVGLAVRGILCGSDIEALSDGELEKKCEQVNIFARISPLDKERIIRVLRQAGNVVNYLGDGINDAPALRAADVGISVDSAADIAKESADIILLEKNLTVLKDGVIEGRKIFANIIKYIKMSASSNFGNIVSIVGGSLFLPFLPMLPVQILLNNLLYDISQTTLPTDTVDPDILASPQKWDVRAIKRFIFCIGPISSLFDYLTFCLMLFVFQAWTNPALFHTGWFVESLLSQTLIIHVIRTKKIPFIQSNASLPVILTTIAVVIIGIGLPFSPYASALGFTPLPGAYWMYIGAMLVVYGIITQGVKVWFYRRYA